MKRYLPLVSLLALFSLIFTGCGVREAARLKIGCSAPLTGEAANYGRSTKEGIDLAIHEINGANYLSAPLEVVFEDDLMQPNVGVNAMRKLIEVEKVPVILGPFGSSVVLAAAPIAERAGVILISASATADAIADAGDYIFRITPPNSKQGTDIANFSFNRLHATKAAIVFQTNDYGLTLKQAFSSRFTDLGGQIVASEGVTLGDSDLRTQLTKIKQMQPQVVFFPLHYRECALFLRQAVELGLVAKFISADGAMTEDMLSLAEGAAEGTFYSTLALGFGTADSAIATFNASFHKFHGHAPDIYAAYYYDVTKLIAQAIKQVGTSADSIKAHLYSITGANAYNGISGRTSFDARGEVDKPFYIYEVKDGKFVIVKL